jgi:predicted DNA-binding WGR domain protein
VRGDATWSIELDGRAVKLRDDRPGEAAETTTRRNTSPAGAWRDAERLIAEKLAAGYVEIIP